MLLTKCICVNLIINVQYVKLIFRTTDMHRRSCPPIQISEFQKCFDDNFHISFLINNDYQCCFVAAAGGVVVVVDDGLIMIVIRKQHIQYI